MKKYNIKNNCSSSPLIKGIIGELFAFTLIELIVVISIITLISSTWIFYFLDFVQEQEINGKLYIVEDEIKQLDKKIKNYEILDYELVFNTTSTWSKSYITYINNFDSENQELIITNTTWSWIIKAINSWSWVIQIYKKNKLYVKKMIDRSIDYNYDFDDSQNYKITWTFSWKTINNIIFNYFTEDNLYPEKNNLLELIKISNTESGSDLWNITITNIWWNKTITDWSNKYNEIYLLFENNWKEKFIKIGK